MQDRKILHCKKQDQNLKDQIARGGKCRTKQVTSSCTNVTHIQINTSCKLVNNSVRLLAKSDINATRKTDTKCNIIITPSQLQSQ